MRSAIERSLPCSIVILFHGFLSILARDCCSLGTLAVDDLGYVLGAMIGFRKHCKIQLMGGVLQQSAKESIFLTMVCDEIFHACAFGRCISITN